MVVSVVVLYLHGRNGLRGLLKYAGKSGQSAESATNCRRYGAGGWSAEHFQCLDTEYGSVSEIRLLDVEVLSYFKHLRDCFSKDEVSQEDLRLRVGEGLKF